MRYAQHIRLRISTAASLFLGWNAGVYLSLLVVAEIPSGGLYEFLKVEVFWSSSVDRNRTTPIGLGPHPRCERLIHRGSSRSGTILTELHRDRRTAARCFSRPGNSSEYASCRKVFQ